MQGTIDINADLGEAWGVYPGPQQVWRANWERGERNLAPDDPLTGPDLNSILESISSANLACGFHAGDPFSLKRYIEACLARGVAIGAHPAYPDSAGFGNRSMSLCFDDLVAVLQYQIAALDGLVRMLGGRLNHVKLHGALYHDAHAKLEVAEAVGIAVAQYNPELFVFGLPESLLQATCKARGLPFCREGFPDRAYLPDGRLQPRSQSEAVIAKPEEVARQGMAMVVEGRVQTISGSFYALRVDTLCIHPDTPKAALACRWLRRALEASKISVGAPQRERTDG